MAKYTLELNEDEEKLLALWAEGNHISKDKMFQFMVRVWFRGLIALITNEQFRAAGSEAAHAHVPEMMDHMNQELTRLREDAHD